MKMNFYTRLKVIPIDSALIFALAAISATLCGCNFLGGYSNESLYPQDIKTVRVEMFDNQSFQRGVEYELTDALAKRIEAQTPYKIVTSSDKADAVISGKITSVTTSVLTLERESGRAMEKGVSVTAVVNFKNLKTGQLLLDNAKLSASAAFSEWQNQGIDYAASLAANKLAQRIAEAMENKW
jgi:hypothetical protein